MESLDINHYISSHLIFNSNVNIIQCGKSNYFTNGAGPLGQSHAKE